MAQPGDVCVLLMPTEADCVDLRAQQRVLRELFGGLIYAPVHLTCQRFRLEDERRVHAVTHSLAEQLARLRGFPVVGESLALIEHPFWQSRLLRWSVRQNAELRTFVTALGRVMASEGIRVHFPSREGWLPGYVTALRDVPAGDLAFAEAVVSFPRRLFDAQRLVLSLIEERRRFTVLEEIHLTGD